MTSLRQRLTQDLQLRGYADRTIEAYVRAVAQLAPFHHASPDRLGEAQIRQYLLHLSTVQKVARGTHAIALCGITFFYQQTLGQPWGVLDVARPNRAKKLPVVLSRDEVWRILGAVRCTPYRACLTTINACGLRLMEGIHLPVCDVDGDRAQLHIHQGKGGKDRYVPLPDATLALLRTRGETERRAPARPCAYAPSQRRHASPRSGRRPPGGAPLSRVWPPRAPSRRARSALARPRPTRRRSVALHPVSRDARSPCHTPPPTPANHRAHRRMRTAVAVAAPPERRATGSFPSLRSSPLD